MTKNDRQKAMVNFLGVVSESATLLLTDLNIYRGILSDNTLNAADEKFADAIRRITDFMQNINFAKAVTLAARYGAAEAIQVKD